MKEIIEMKRKQLTKLMKDKPVNEMTAEEYAQGAELTNEINALLSKEK